MKQSSFLWSRDRQVLHHSWMELAGHLAPTLQLLLNARALMDPVRFIGIDNDPKVVRECEKHYAGAPATWVNNDIEATLKRREAFPDVGILVFDSEYALHGERLLPAIRVVSRFARWQYERIGEFLLVINAVAPERRSTDEDVESYRKQLEEVLEMDVPPASMHTYKSLSERMIWTPHTFGF